MEATGTRKLIPRRTKLERVRTLVINDILDGFANARMAEKYSCSVVSIHAFKQRHAQEIAEKLTLFEGKVEALTIANKASRIAAKDRRWQLLEALRQARAKGESGEETGLLGKTYKIIGHGEDTETVIEYKLDDGLLSAMEKVERGAAEELGQLPKQGDSYVFNGQNQQFNLFDRSQALAFAKAILEVDDEQQHDG